MSSRLSVKYEEQGGQHSTGQRENPTGEVSYSVKYEVVQHR